ncbi:GyrI-like domain-containing protein [Paucibacter sp. TC2R-5]|uniref:GyrI-like domain-containing protein n=1 Tax=Paucibacter sp. TC2R-5 TaxID=2893555 RepID=UPI0021E3716F|nr:GyrI-like domain-containing protein [Paucibacter sp. TC2R-5]MCV2359030.1 GyrI-like domain-containing protein [Paucibacter sp. TC2R-5]
MQREKIASFQVQGPSCRTSNAAEFNPLTGRIGPLWQEFAASGLGTDLSQVFGVYFDYADRHLGEYSVMAGVKRAEAPSAGERSVNIPAGEYLVFDCKGPMPGALIAGWGQVWAHFAQPDAPARAYGHDFERYLGLDHAQICIGLKA